MGYYSERHGNKPEALSKSGRSYFRERHQDEIPKSESVLSRALKIGRNIYGPTAQAVGGAFNTAGFSLPGVAVDKLAPEPVKKFIEPTGIPEQIGRVVGDVGGFMFGGPMKLAGKGAMKLLPKAGRFTRGALEGAGSMVSMSPSELATGSTPEHEALKVGGAGLLGGTAERVGNLFMKGAFRKNMKKAKLDSLLKDLEDLKGRAESGQIEYDETQLLNEAESIYSQMAPAVRRKATELKVWIDDLRSRATSKILDPKGRPYQKPPMVRADEVRQMEQELGSAAKFGGTKGGFLQFMRPKSPAADKAYKAGRRSASGAYDDIAGKEFEEKSSKVASILKRYPDLDPSKGSKDFGERVAAALLGKSVSGSNLASFIAYEVAKALQLPEARQAIFKGITSKSGKAITSGVKKASVASVSEL